MPRKIVDGKIRNKARTKEKLLDAVGKILKTKGHTALGVNRIAEVAKLDKKLIYVYFGSVDKLIETYVKKQEYWSVLFEKSSTELVEKAKNEIDANKTTEELVNLFDYFYSSKEMQKIILWEISEKNKALKNIATQREAFAGKLFEFSDSFFTNNDIDFRALMAIQIAGLYHLVLNGKANGTTFCGIDITKEADRKRIEQAINQIQSCIFEKAKQKKK
jgi:AcrR family transcriptional regulator